MFRADQLSLERFFSTERRKQGVHDLTIRIAGENELNTTMEKNYEGWCVKVKCKAANDENGGESTFDAFAEARLFDPQYFENGWIEVDAIAIPDLGFERFSDCSTANKILWERTTSAIDALKKFE